MRQDPLLASIGGMLRRFKRAEAWLRSAGLPVSLARVPVWVLCLHYCIMMRRKTARITRIAERITHWLETITEMSRHDKARTELLDMDGGMRSDIESTKRTLMLLREVCVDVGGMFHSIGFKARILENTQERFLAVVEESCATATTLQRAFAMHDARALALLREIEQAERPIGMATDGMTDAVTDAVMDAVTDAVAGMERELPSQQLPGAAPDREGGPLLLEPLVTPAKA